MKTVQQTDSRVETRQETQGHILEKGQGHIAGNEKAIKSTKNTNIKSIMKTEICSR